MSEHQFINDGPGAVVCKVCGGYAGIVGDTACPGQAVEVKTGERTPATILRSGADQFAAKDALYGSSYKSVGKLMEVLFPQGLTVKTEAEWNRLCIMVQVVGKFHRYSANLTTGGHQDSAHDMMVYSAMLKEVTQEEAGALSGSLK